ncbi:MAG: c-type cytochrome [Thermomicrobiales bacterium]
MLGDSGQQFGFGQAAKPEEIAGWDIDVKPDGTGLPEGSGSVEQGKALFLQYGAAWHGVDGEGTDYAPALVGGIGSLDTDKPKKTVGSYWPFATSVFSYIRRAMPASGPQTLTNDEYYALTAWVLWANGIIGEKDVMDKNTLPKVIMPNRDGFTSPDPRPDVENIAN